MLFGTLFDDLRKLDCLININIELLKIISHACRNRFILGVNRQMHRKNVSIIN